MASEKEILQQMRGLVASGWAQGEYARDADGFSVSAVSDAAICFCPVGAAFRVCGALAFYRITNRLHEAVAPGWPGVANWNDAPERTKNDVLALLDRMIAEAA